MPLLLIPLAFILLVAILYAYRFYAQWNSRKNYELLKNRETKLKKLIEAVSGDYTTQRIPADQASKKIIPIRKRACRRKGSYGKGADENEMNALHERFA